MRRPKPADGEVLLWPRDGDDEQEFVIRGRLTTAQAAEAVNGWDPDLVAVGEASQTWARRGLWVDDDGDVRKGGLHLSRGYEGKRGAFVVTVIEAGPKPG